MTPHPDEQALELDWQAAAKRVDWMQILLNLMNGQETGRDGQPCFFIGGGHFCGRAKFWPGHDDQHRFVSLLDLLERAAAPSLHKEGWGAPLDGVQTIATTQGTTTVDRGSMGINLRGIASTVAIECGDKGAVVVTYGKEGIRVGVENLTPEELREALCTAIHYSYDFEDDLRKRG